MRISGMIALLLVPVFVTTLVRAEPNLQSNALHPDPRVESMVNEAFAREASGDWKGAIDLYQKILKIYPREVRAMNSISGAYGELVQFREMAAWAKRAFTFDPKYMPAYVNYGSALVELGRVGEAEKAYRQARRLEPSDPVPVYSLGTIAERRRRIREAVGYYQMAVLLDPGFEDAYFNLAGIYLDLKKYKEAITNLKKVLELNPDAEDAKAMLTEIEQKRNNR